MSLWSKLEPICRGVSYDAAFSKLIESRKYGFFSEETYKVCGYYEEKFLLIGLELFDAKHQCGKRISHALHINLDTFETSLKVFKSCTTVRQQALNMLASIGFHEALEKDFPEAVAKAPMVLGTRETEKKEYLCVDTMEVPYPTTLSKCHVLKGKISVNNALQGHFNIALALDALHKMNFIHRDLKNWNIFVADGKLLLFDFDLGVKFPDKFGREVNYEFWDLMSNKFGYVHPFCDVFGWTATLATILWGKKFYLHLRNYRDNPNFFNDIAGFPRAKVDTAFYVKAFVFIKSVFQRDVEAYNSVLTYYYDELNKKTPAKEIATELFKKTHATLPKMQDCIDFIRPWVSLQTVAK